MSGSLGQLTSLLIFVDYPLSNHGFSNSDFYLIGQPLCRQLFEFANIQIFYAGLNILPSEQLVSFEIKLVI